MAKYISFLLLFVGLTICLGFVVDTQNIQAMTKVSAANV
jgi:hypothetical protein